MALVGLSMPLACMDEACECEEEFLSSPNMAADIYSPTVDLGRDFEMLIRRCIEEKLAAETRQEDNARCDFPMSFETREEQSQNEREVVEEEVQDDTAENNLTESCSEKSISGIARQEDVTKNPESTVHNTMELFDEDFPILCKDIPVSEKYGQFATKAKLKDHKKKKPSRKWKTLGEEFVGFNLLPREQKPTEIDETMVKELRKFESLCKLDGESANSSEGPESSASEKEKLCSDNVQKSIDSLQSNIEDGESVYRYTFPNSLDLENRVPRTMLNLAESFRGLGASKRLRRKKKWRIDKAHKQVKDKYCTSVSNVTHGKKLWIHYRVVGRMPLMLGVFYTPSLSIKRIDKSKGLPRGSPRKTAAQNMTESPTSTSTAKRVYPIARPSSGQALTAYNADGDLSSDLVNILIALQDRDLTPEDYETLLRLDERVAPKTVQENVLNSLKTDTVTVVTPGEICMVCMDEYSLQQKRKHLPCGHVFHADCIDTWLNKNSQNCPLDGLPVSNS